MHTLMHTHTLAVKWCTALSIIYGKRFENKCVLLHDIYNGFYNLESSVRNCKHAMRNVTCENIGKCTMLLSLLSFGKPRILDKLHQYHATCHGFLFQRCEVTYCLIQHTFKPLIRWALVLKIWYIRKCEMMQVVDFLYWQCKDLYTVHPRLSEPILSGGCAEVFG